MNWSTIRPEVDFEKFHILEATILVKAMTGSTGFQIDGKTQLVRSLDNAVEKKTSCTTALNIGVCMEQMEV